MLEVGEYKILLRIDSPTVLESLVIIEIAFVHASERTVIFEGNGTTVRSVVSLELRPQKTGDTRAPHERNCPTVGEGGGQGHVT